MSGLWRGASPRARVGLVLIALGLALILWGVLHVLGEVGGPQRRDFAHRRTYTQVKQAVHGAFAGMLLRALPGLALVLLGARLRSASAASDHPEPPDPP